MFSEYYKKQAGFVLDILGMMNWDDCFALKGGTAINFFVTDMPRLSVDIDLTYLPGIPRDKAFKEMLKFLTNYKTNFQKKGFQAIHSNISQNNPVGKLIVINQNIRIIIEPNIILRGSVLPPATFFLTEKSAAYFGKEISVKCLDKSELYAGKITAMCDRQHPRDIFDIMVYLKKNGNISKLMDLFMVYLLQTNRPFHEILKPNILDIKAVFEHSFHGMTNFSVKLENLEKTREKIFREILKKLTDKHIQFLLNLLENKMDWSLLPFGDLSHLPGVAWKIHNIKKMKKQKRLEQIKALEDLK